MDATITVQVYPRHAVPEGAARVPWLDAHGVPPERAEVQVTLSLTEWARCGVAIDEGGAVDLSRDGRLYEEPAVKTHLLNRILATITETGSVPKALDGLDALKAGLEFARLHGAWKAKVDAKEAEASAAKATREAAERESRAAAVRAWLAAPPEVLEAQIESRDTAPGEHTTFASEVLPVVKLSWSDELLARAVAAYERLQVAKVEAVKGVAAALDAWLVEHGTATQVARRAAGFMPDKEIRDMVRAAIFAPLDDRRPYHAMNSAEVAAEHESESVDNPEPKFETLDKSDGIAITDEQWAEVEALRAALPGSDVEPRIHRGFCNCDDSECKGEVRRPTALVTVNWHGTTLSREFLLPANE
jgi:hypothetical protein